MLVKVGLVILHVAQHHAQILQPKSQAPRAQAVIGRPLTHGEHQELLRSTVLAGSTEVTHKAALLGIRMEMDALQVDMVMVQMDVLCQPMPTQRRGLLVVKSKFHGVLLQTMEVDTLTGCVPNQPIRWISRKSASSKILCHWWETPNGSNMAIMYLLGQKSRQCAQRLEPFQVARNGLATRFLLVVVSKEAMT
jgi:hypothetical protein